MIEQRQSGAPSPLRAVMQGVPFRASNCGPGNPPGSTRPAHYSCPMADTLMGSKRTRSPTNIGHNPMPGNP